MFLKPKVSAGRLAALSLALVLLLAACTSEDVEKFFSAVTSAAVTPTIPIGGDGAPGAPQGVTVQCMLVTLSDGKLLSTCRFTNTTDEPRRFMFCMMFDLREELRQDVPGISGVLVTVSKTGNTVGCTKTDATGRYSSTSYHFGCEEVDLGPGQSKLIVFEGKSVYKPPEDLTVKAQDFMVTYADTALLDVDDVLDFTDCRLEEGEEQAGFVLFDRNSDLIGAYWVVYKVAFEDPYISHQPPGAGPGQKQYALLNDAPCLPAEFPASVEQLDTCPETEGVPPPLAVDLNLFFYASHTAELNAVFPTVMEVETQGDAEGVRIETTPAADEPFDILGGVEEFGTLRACAAEVVERCETPDVPEGQVLEVTVSFLDQETGELLFRQFVSFFADTEPPVVREAFVEDERLVVVATDETTSPIHATAWFSSDGGESWEPVAMETEPPVIGDEAGSAELHSREFTVALPDEQDGLQYFVVVQDSVYNLTFYGVEDA